MSEKTKISIISIGDELLKGKTLNTNLNDIGCELMKIGIIPEFQVTVKDKKDDIINILNYSLSKSNILIITGGLGPTTDDITVQTVADYFNLKVSINKNALKYLKEFLAKCKVTAISKNNLKQVYLPEKSKPIINHNGTAPGVFIEILGKTLFLLPGPPHELKAMLSNNVIPYIKTLEIEKSYYETVYAMGISESDFQKIVSDTLGGNYNKFTISFRANPGLCELMILGHNKEEVKSAINKIKNTIKDFILSDDFSHPVEEIIYLFKKNGWTLATAESCTGGLISSIITDYPGVSAFFKGSCISYSNEIKQNILNVKNNTIEEFGAVSKETAKEMVEGLCNKFNVDAGIAVTGIAGPDGGTESKPVGLVFIAVKFFNKLNIKKYNFVGSREIIRERIVVTALNDLRKLIIK